MNELREEINEHLKTLQSPSDIFALMLGGEIIGGKRLRTKHEKMFALLCPGMAQQVVFGTGKGGVKKYESKKFTADFYNESIKTVIEIDGPGHRSQKRRYKDLVRTLFFLEVHQIKTVRFTNKQVEEMLERRIKEIEQYCTEPTTENNIN
jgi:hypothetical protein